MKAQYIKNVDLKQLRDLKSDFWKKIQPNILPMNPTPVAMQPTQAIRSEWESKPYGLVKEVSLSAAHNGRFVAFRLEWTDPNQDENRHDNSIFSDGAAVMLASVSGAPVTLMGAPGMPVNILYWRADEGEQGRNIVAEGIGTSRTVDQEMVVCTEQWANNTWQVIIARPLKIDTKEGIAQLSSGKEMAYGVVIWNGAGGERAGIKSYAAGGDQLVIGEAG